MRVVKPTANTGIAKTKAASRKQRRDADKKDVSMPTKKKQKIKKISEAVASVPKSRRGILVATYKKKPDQMGWIVKHNLYNYALSAEEATATKKDDWNKVKELWLYSGPKDQRHIYEAEFVGVKPRKEFLAEYPDYPKGKTKHGDFYALFKVAIRYEPTTENFQVVVRAPDFNRTPEVAKAARAYQAGGELGSLLDYLPDELAPLPHDQLYVCEAAIQLDFLYAFDKNVTDSYIDRARQIIAAAKKRGKMTCVEICAGAGGQAIGLDMAGFDHVALVEYEPEYCAVLRANRPDWNVICGDVHKFDGKPFAGVDLFAGGVPCPPFSVASKQLGANDERDLFPEAIRLIEEIRPKAVMLENVRGFLDPKFDKYRQSILDSIGKLGYRVSIKLLHASDFGVPQLRPRVVIVGIRNDVAGDFTYPKSICSSTPTVGEVLYGLMAAKGWKNVDSWSKGANKIAPTVVGGSKKHGGPDLGPARARRAWAELGVDGLGIANEAPEPDFVGMPRLTKEMLSCIQGFPKTWDFGHRKTAACRMIGNAFPPPVANAVGNQIRKVLENEED